MEIRTKNLIIGQIVNQTITLPILEIGSGRPCIGIVGGIHGNEPESLFLIREIVRSLPSSIPTSLKILPGANPFGLILNTRVGAFDYLDLNRSFPGKKNGTITERIAAAIFEEFFSCDIVIDIHSVTNWGDFMGMELSTQNLFLIERTRCVNRLLRPPVIWKAVEGATYARALDESLLARGVCGVGVEVPRLEFLTPQLIERIVDGFLRVINDPYEAPPLSSPIPVFSGAQRYFSDRGGLYTPVMKLWEAITPNDTVGIITDLSTFKDYELKSDFNGFLFVQSTRKLLKTGDKVYVVVQKIGEFV